MNRLRVSFHRIAFGMTVVMAVSIAGASSDADNHGVAEVLSKDLYRLTSSVSVLTNGCTQEGGKVRIDRRAEKIIFIDDASAECRIETWVAPVSAELL